MGKVMDCGLHIIVGVPESCKRVGKFVTQPGSNVTSYVTLILMTLTTGNLLS